MKIFLLINVKMPTIVGILIFMSRKSSILGLSESKKSQIYWYFYTYEHLKFHAQLSWAWKMFYNLGASLASVWVPAGGTLPIVGRLSLHTTFHYQFHLFDMTEIMLKEVFNEKSSNHLYL